MCDLRQQDEQVNEANFRETVEPEVLARFLGFSKCGVGDSNVLLPVPKVKYGDRTKLLIL